MNPGQKLFQGEGRFSLKMVSIAAIAMGILLRILNLGGREYWYDEALSVIFVAGRRGEYEWPPEVPVDLDTYTALLNVPPASGLSDIAANIASVLRGITNNQHAPLFYIFHNFWMRWFGNSEIATRSLVVLMSVGAIAAVYGWGRKLLGDRAALLFAALLAVNPFYLAQSLHFRMHGALPLWAALSGWAMLNLTLEKRDEGTATTEENLELDRQRSLTTELTWSIILIGSVTAGLLTNYLFSYWAIALAILSLYLNPRRWFLHGVRLGIAGLLTVPWIWWGVRQQLRNARFVIEQFGADEGESAAFMHVKDILTAFGAQFVLGEWITSLPSASVTIAGAVAIALFGAAIVHLWKIGDRRLLIVALLLSVLPLAIGIATDILAEKFTVGWGGGRAILFILPGFLFLLTLWLDRAAGRWRNLLAASLLAFYLIIGIADYSLRDRRPFHQIADAISTEPNAPTLIVTNAIGWGHILRLAYYIPSSANVDLLARKPDELAADLQRFFSVENLPYSQIIWLDAARPAWSPPATPEENQQVETVLQEQFCPETSCVPTVSKNLSGTMELDRFTLKVYKR